MSHLERYLLLAVVILSALLTWQFHREDELIKRFHRLEAERSLLTLERIPL